MIEENEIPMMIIGQNYPFFPPSKIINNKNQGYWFGAWMEKGNISSKGVSIRIIYSKDRRISTIHSEKTFKPMPI